MNKVYRINITKRLWSLALAFLLLAALPLGVSADSPSGFTPRALIPENQVDKRQTYFDLRLMPGQTQTVQLSINNSEDRAIVANVELNPASTAQNGLIIYSVADARDESVTHSIVDVAKVVQKQVEIPPMSSRLVDISIAMPEEQFDGMVLGGLVVTADYPQEDEPAQESEADNQGGGFVIQNRFSYVIGLKITQNDDLVKPDFHLKSISPGLSNYRPVILVNLQNSQPRIAKNMVVTAQVFQRGSDEVLRELSLQNAEMAPNSNGDFVIDWGSSRIQPGVYRLKLRVEMEDEVWEWDEEFTIASDEAGEVNNEAIGLEKEGLPLWVYLLPLCLIFLLLLVLAFLLGKRRSQQKNNQ